jgi:hypothetical protein
MDRPMRDERLVRALEAECAELRVELGTARGTAERLGRLAAARGGELVRLDRELGSARAMLASAHRALGMLARELAFGEQRFERLAELVLDGLLDEEQLDSLLNSPSDSQYGRKRYPGKYEAARVPELAEGLDSMLGSGYADETAGSVEFRGHAARIGRAIVETDSQGFVTYELLDSDELAEQRFAELALVLDAGCECDSDECECDR